MLSLSRRRLMSLSAASLMAAALSFHTAQAATGTLPLNGSELPSGSLRFIPLEKVTYTCQFAQAFTRQQKTFTATPVQASDALVQATFTTARPAAGSLSTRVLARRTDDGANFYAAVLTLKSSGALNLSIERVINQRSSIIASQDLPIKAGTGTSSFELSLSVRATRLVAQVLVPGQAANSLTFNDTAVPFASTPNGQGTGISAYAGSGVARDHSIIATAASAGPWGVHRGSKTAPGWGALVFDEDFDGSAIDTRRWTVRDRDYVSYDAGVNLKELVALTGNSTAKIWMKKLATPITFSDGKPRSWGTGYMDTIGKFSANYFRIEYRAKHPASYPHQVGVWGGLWMRPDNGGLKGEIDIAESYGYHSGKQTMVSTNLVESTVHFGKKPNGKLDKSGALSPAFGQTPTDEFHVWVAEKTPAGVRFFMDGIEIHFVPASDSRYSSAIPAAAKFHLRLNIQAGNSYWGGPNAQTRDSAVEVDYVRIWAYKG